MGRHDYALDPKKRFTIPSEWRANLGSVVYVMPDRKVPCLNLYSEAEMGVFLGQLRQKALLDPALNRLYSRLGAVCQQLTLDSQGRIRISDRLLQFANLTTTVAIVGSFRLIKLFDPAFIGPEDKVDMGEIDAMMTAVGL